MNTDAGNINNALFGRFKNLVIWSKPVRIIMNHELLNIYSPKPDQRYFTKTTEIPSIPQVTVTDSMSGFYF